jgi:predicted metal-dependent HD superfamily phosphohydrolase
VIHPVYPLDGDVAAGTGADLLRRWSEPHRHYHTISHLALMLDVIDRHAELADDALAVRLAAWFHDAVYDPRAGDNERQSADLAREALDGSPVRLADEVVRLVLLTKDHEADTRDRNGALLCDADLAILASDPDVYARYAAAVREEYAFVPDELFRAGRAAVLRQIRDLPTLFRVIPERAQWTARAHTNLDAEIKALT